MDELLYSEESLRDFLLNFDYRNDSEVRYIPKDKALGATTAYLTIPEMAELSAEVNDAGLVLMTYYLRKVKTPKFDFFNDSTVSDALKWSVSKTKKTRLALINKGWLKKLTFTQSSTKAKFTVFYLGKEMCSRIDTPEEYSAQVKALEAIEEKQMLLTKKFGLDSWEEVRATKSVSEIQAALNDC